MKKGHLNGLGGGERPAGKQGRGREITTKAIRVLDDREARWQENRKGFLEGRKAAKEVVPAAAADALVLDGGDSPWPSAARQSRRERRWEVAGAVLRGRGLVCTGLDVNGEERCHH